MEPEKLPTVEEFEEMLHGSAPMRNNAVSRALDLAFGGTQELKRLASLGSYDQLEALERQRRAYFDCWLAYAHANARRLRDHRADVPGIAKSAGAR